MAQCRNLHTVNSCRKAETEYSFFLGAPVGIWKITVVGIYKDVCMINGASRCILDEDFHKGVMMPLNGPCNMLSVEKVFCGKDVTRLTVMFPRLEAEVFS